MEEFNHFGTVLKYHNSIMEEIKSRLQSGNACYHSVQDILSPSFPFKKWKDEDIQNNKCAICFVGCEIFSLTLREERVWECSRIGDLGKYFGLRGRKLQRSGENYIVRSLVFCIYHQIFFGWSNQEEGIGRVILHVWGEESCIHSIGGGAWGK